LEPKTCNNARHLELIKSTRLDRCPSCLEMPLWRFPRRLPEVRESMNGIVKIYDSQKFVGTIEDAEGKLHLVKRNSMRRDILLREGMRVSFVSVNLSDGANAQQIRLL